MKTFSTGELVTIEAAVALGVTRRTLERWIAAGELARYAGPHKRRRYLRRADVERLLVPTRIDPQPRHRRLSEATA